MANATTTDGAANADSGSLTTIMSALVVVSLLAALPKRLLDSVPVAYVMLIAVMLFTMALIAAGVDLEYFYGALYVSKNNSQFLQALYLPPLIFSEVFKLNLPTFQRTFWQVVWLIVPGVVFGTALTAVYVMYLLPTGAEFNANEALCFGGALSATDPIAVLIVLHEMGAPARLRALVGGESLLNDGSSIIMVALFLQLMEGQTFTAGGIVVFALEELVLAPVIGILVGVVTLYLMLYIEDQVIPLVTLSFASPYIAFNLSANTFGLSGVMALIAMGLVMNRFGRAILTAHMHHIEAYWMQIEFIATNLLYTQSGIYLGSNLSLGNITWEDWGSLLGLYLWITLVRALMVLLSFPLLQRIGYGIDWKEAVVMVHGGLRGSLCILLSFAIASSSGVSSPKVASLTLFFAAGLVLLMCINVVTTGPLCDYLGLKFDNTQPVYLQLKREIANSTVNTLRLASSTSTATTTGTTPESPMASHSASQLSLSTQRYHLALAYKQCFDSLLEAKLISRPAWFTLLLATERTMEEHDFTSAALVTWADLDLRWAKLWLRLWYSKYEYDAVCRYLEGAVANEETTDSPPPPNAVVEYLVYCAFGLLTAHERGRDEVLKHTFAGQHEDAQAQLVQESLQASLAPADIINRAFVHFPKSMERVKLRHARTQVHHCNMHVLESMQQRGVLNEIVHKQLGMEVDKMDQYVAGLEFQLTGELAVGQHGERLGRNTNFGPWEKQQDVA